MLHIHMDHNRPLDLKTRALAASSKISQNLRCIRVGLENEYIISYLTSNLVDRCLSEQFTPFFGMGLLHIF